MFGILSKTRQEVREKMVYLEVYAENKVSYRVTSGITDGKAGEVITYGIEAEDRLSGEKEIISDFSRNIEDAVDFAEMLIKGRIRPRQIYGKALNYLSFTI